MILLNSPEITAIEVAGEAVRLRALALEDLFLVKLAANRPKDLADVTMLATKIDLDRLFDRLASFLRWHGNRGAIPAYLDGFVRALRDELRLDPRDVIARLPVPETVKAMLQESFYGPDAD